VDVAVIGKVRCVGGRASSALCHPYNRQPKEIVQPQERWDLGIKVALALWSVFDTYVVSYFTHTHNNPPPLEKDAKWAMAVAKLHPNWRKCPSEIPPD
jgi:hypothetical protein